MSHPFIPAINTVRVELRQQTNFNAIAFGENVFHVYNPGGWDSSTMNNLGMYVYNWWNASWHTLISAHTSLQGIRITKLDAQSDIVIDYDIGGALAGTDNGQPLAPQTSFCIKFQSGLSGRSARGRWYIFGLTANYMNGVGLIAPASAAAWRASLDNLRTLYIPTRAGNDLVITSYRHNKAWRATALNYLVTSIAYTDLYADNQRRRALGRGI